MRVYLAAAIGANDEGRRARIDTALGCGARLFVAGLDPFIPHLWPAAMNADGLGSYERWMAYDESFLRVCQALLRLPGVSPGADREVAYANALGIPVFHDEGELVGWFRGLRPAWAVAR